MILSGEYNSGLKLAFDQKSNKLTGYFENYTGFDEKTFNPKFSCIFYIEGTIESKQFKINTYFPNDTSFFVEGNIEIVDEKTVKIKLAEEHGGCWNVQHFANEEVNFSLEKKAAWAQIRFVTAEKAYFYSSKSIDKIQKSYLIKNDFVCIEKIENDWAFCTYYGNSITTGWIKTSDLNKM